MLLSATLPNASSAGVPSPIRFPNLKRELLNSFSKTFVLSLAIIISFVLPLYAIAKNKNTLSGINKLKIKAKLPIGPTVPLAVVIKSNNFKSPIKPIPISEKV